MSSFRPSARVTAPDGREWELYAYKITLPKRGPLEPLADDEGAYGGRGYIVAAPFLLVAAVGRGLVRLLVDIPVATLRSLCSDEWTVEAVTFGPHRESHVWRTTRERRGQVLASVEGSLARGDFPRPPNAGLVS